MSTRDIISVVDRFAGLSDRSNPVQITRIESPDLLNVDFSDYTIKRRKGYSRLTTEQFLDSSVRMDGYADFARIGHTTNYDPTNVFGLSFHCKLNSFPTSEVTVVSRGYGTGANRFLQISYDPSINSNLGGWRVRVYDADTAAIASTTINDGDANRTQLGKTRLIDFNHSGSGDVYDFTAVDGSGVINASTVTVVGFVSDTFDWIIGCDTTDGTTIPAEGDTSYAPISFAELRIQAFLSSASTSIDIYGRELINDAALDEAATLDGYWKFNEGTGVELTDLVNGNSAFIGSSGADWSFDTTKVIGPQGLEFFGERGHLQVDATNVATDTFAATARLWTLSFVFTPKMAANETTVRDQTLFWSGSDSTGSANPEPLGIRVVSDKIEIKYDDATTLATVTLNLALSTVVDQPLRLIVNVDSTKASEFLSAVIIPSDGTTALVGSGQVAVTGVPATVSNNWSIGRRVNSYALPVTFPSGVRSAFCILDDFVLYRNYTTAGTANSLPGGVMLSAAPNNAGVVRTEFNKVSGFSSTPGIALVWSLPLDGNLNTGGSKVSTAIQLPPQNIGFSFDAGLVVPDRAPEITMLRDFRRTGSNGSFKRSILAISGTSLYEVDPSTGASTLITGGLEKGGKWSHTQYAGRVFLACKNGRPPVVFDGSSVSAVGIYPPVTAPVSTTAAVAGGTMTSSATYQVYVTFRNASSGVESNPSPVEAVTLGGSHTGITSMYIPVSRDPQVNQRRIWITAAGGAAGSSAFLSATVDDNTTTNYTTDITGLGVTPILEYLDNEQAPIGSLVRAWKDRLWVAGGSEAPTRIFYSQPGTLTGFNTVTGYEDADLDAGDPVVGLRVLRDNLIAYLRDGRVGISATGDLTVPFFLSRLNQDTGAVSEHSTIAYENRHLFLGERDVWIWSGDDATNLSSPTSNDRPSVKTFIRETINDNYKHNASMALDRSRDQLWIAVATGTSTRNDQVLALNLAQGVWSKYQMQMDILAEIEDGNDEPTLYGGSEGYVVKLNQTNGDGGALRLTATSGTTGSVTVSGAGWTADAYKGLHVCVYDGSEFSSYSLTVSRNTTDTIYFRTAAPATLVTTDSFTLGGIPWYIDFEADFGDPTSLKRAKWLKFYGAVPTDPSNTQYVKAVMEPNVFTKVWTLPTTVAFSSKEWEGSSRIFDGRFGGLGRSFRIRLTSSPIENLRGDVVFPDAENPIEIARLQFEAEEVSAR